MIKEYVRCIVREEMRKMDTKPTQNRQMIPLSKMLNTNELLKQAEHDIKEIIEAVEMLSGCEVDSIRWATKYFSDTEKRLMITLETKTDDDKKSDFNANSN